MQVYRALARAYGAASNCEKSGNVEWLDIWKDRIDNAIMRERMPSGSGVDNGTVFDWDASRENRLVLSLSFHHIDDMGAYDGWTDHKAIIEPDLQFGFVVRVTGRNKRDIKDYLGSLLHHALGADFGDWRD